MTNLMKMKKREKIFVIASMLGGCYSIMRMIAKKGDEGQNMNEGNPYWKKPDEPNRLRADALPLTIYEKSIKPATDKMLAFGGLLFLSPVFGLISLAVYLDDPGPVIFTQKRVGKNREFFSLHKFRSMKMDTPHDMPTHMLENPEQYITGVGRILRKYSLDELPQIWDIFRGKMSVIGPRPALWNQEDLVACRDLYGANDVLPGLTGLAQIQGRDELEIVDKARLDGEYVKELHKGGYRAFIQDAKCFLSTVGCVLKHEGVIEGGTGKIKRDGKSSPSFSHISPSDAGFEDYGYRKTFHIDRSTANHKRVLITGAGSYIGESFETYAREHYGENFSIDTVDMKDPSWKERDFTPYDAVLHVAGIAHDDTGKTSEKIRERYYAVNTELAVETAKKARDEGVKQFILMSSMIVYGESAPYGKEKVIDEHTLPAPSGYYGDSKWQADKRVRELESGGFHVAVLRPPIVYGKGSKGNYPVLSKLAKRLPVFPDVENQRSMLHIDNLCEFLSLLILSGEDGVYFPQNREYSNTCQLVKKISTVKGKTIKLTKLLTPLIVIGSHWAGKPGQLVNKAFGNSAYDQKISRYSGLDYRVIDLPESIEKTERPLAALERSVQELNFCEQDKVHSCNIFNPSSSAHILIVSQYFYPETFRINDIAREWVKRGYKVTVLTGIPNYPMGKFYDGYNYIKKRHEQRNGITVIRIPLIPRGKSSIGMAANYFSFVASGFFWIITNKIKADLVFTFEVSPMTQALIGVWYSKKHHIPHFLYVQDLWPENVKMVTGWNHPVIIKPINSMVDYVYQNTDEIFTTSPSFTNEIINREIPVDKKKVHYWPQYAEEFYKALDKGAVRKNASKVSPVNLIPDNDNFKIAFTGNIGMAQGLDILPKTAKLLKNCAVQFIIIGDGRYQKAFEKEIKRQKAEDCFIMIPRQPAEVIPELLACCDAAFLSFMESELFEKTIPAKLQSYMACGMPIVAAAQGETKRIIEQAKCGICVPIGDSSALANAIKELINSSSAIKQMGENSKRNCKDWFDKTRLMDEMDQYIVKALEQK